MTISKELESTIQGAFEEARKRRHEFVTLEHVLYALTKDPVAAKILKAAGADLKKLQAELLLEVSKRLLHDVKELQDRLNQNPDNSSRPAPAVFHYYAWRLHCRGLFQTSISV